MTGTAEWLKAKPGLRGDLAELGIVSSPAEGRWRLNFPPGPITPNDRDVIRQIVSNASVHTHRPPQWFRQLERTVRDEWVDGERRWER